VQCVDATESSLLLAWAPIPGAVRYELQWRPVAAPEGDDAESWSFLGQDGFKSGLPPKQKSGLGAGSAFEFRLRGRDHVDWLPWGAVARHATLEAGAWRLPPCTLRACDAESLTVEWEAPLSSQTGKLLPSAYRYELQVRDSTCDAGWTTVSASLKGTVAKKKNLSQDGRYSFRVRPFVQDDGAKPGEKWAFSAPNATDFRVKFRKSTSE